MRTQELSATYSNCTKHILEIHPTHNSKQCVVCLCSPQFFSFFFQLHFPRKGSRIRYSVLSIMLSSFVHRVVMSRVVMASPSVSFRQLFSTTDKKYEHPVFRVLGDTVIKEYNVRAITYEHTKSGALVLSTLSSDNDKVFGITFRTPLSVRLPHSKCSPLQWLLNNRIRPACHMCWNTAFSVGAASIPPRSRSCTC